MQKAARVWGRRRRSPLATTLDFDYRQPHSYRRGHGRFRLRRPYRHHRGQRRVQNPFLIRANHDPVLECSWIDSRRRQIDRLTLHAKKFASLITAMKIPSNCLKLRERGGLRSKMLDANLSFQPFFPFRNDFGTPLSEILWGLIRQRDERWGSRGFSWTFFHDTILPPAHEKKALG